MHTALAVFSPGAEAAPVEGSDRSLMGCISCRRAMKQPGEKEPVLPAQMVDRCEHQIGYQNCRRDNFHFLGI